MRIALGKILLQDPDLLLLDGPRTTLMWKPFSGWKTICRSRPLPWS